MRAAHHINHIEHGNPAKRGIRFSVEWTWTCGAEVISLPPKVHLGYRCDATRFVDAFFDALTTYKTLASMKWR
jgi:hypothetical protein